ncbi:MAG: nucleotidyltransferase family protein [bacterium]
MVKQQLDTIILAGGLGTRLQTAVADLPKPLAPVNGQPFLNYLLNHLRRAGIKRVVLATGHLHHKIEDYYGTSYHDLEIDYSMESEPLGTGGGIRKALTQTTTDEVLILNGDSFFDFDLQTIWRVHKLQQADLTIALKPMQNIARYGIVRTESSRVISFEEKKPVEFGYINTGVYLAQKNLFDGFNLPQNFSIEADFLKKYTRELQIHACISNAYFIDIGIPEDYEKAQIEMRRYE